MLDGKLVSLRELEIHDLDQLFLWGEQEDLYLFKGRYRFASQEDLKNNFTGYSFSQKIFVISSRLAPIGFASYWDENHKNRTCEFYAKIYDKSVDSQPYLAHIYKWRNDPELMRFYGLYPIQSLDKVQEEIKANKNLKNRLDFVVLSKNNPIGMVWVKRIDWINSNCELNCMIGEKDFRSKMFGAEAIFLLLLFCMNELNLHKVYAKIIEFARESHDLVSHAGFKKEAVLRKMVFQDGKYRDLIVYGLLRREFEAFINSTQGQKYLLSSKQVEKKDGK